MINLFEHNQTAFDSAVTMLKEVGKAAIIHPTGTGKSFIGFKLCEVNRDKSVLWLSPSEYIFKTQIDNLRAASNGYAPDNIKFFTYAKLMQMPICEIEEICPDYIVLDEFHRCGAEFWGQGVRNVLSAYPSVPILGLSATAIRYLDNQRDMSDELFDGNIASEMTLGEAIVRGILTPPKYVLSVFSYKQELDRFEKRAYNAQSRIVRDKAEKHIEALRRALEKADGLDRIFEKHIEDKAGKYIVFCLDKKHMDEMIAHVPEWFGKIDTAPTVYTAYSSDPETSKAFSDFKSDASEHLKLLFCIDMLNEGIHIDDVSGVILFRPTVSPIVYKQQIGRAMSASNKNNSVIFDIVNNIGSLYSISSLREEMQDAIEYLRSAGEADEIVNDTFTVIDEVRDCIKLFDELEGILSASWDYMYEEAKSYYNQHGDLLVPSHYITETGYNLGWWLVLQRGIYNGTHIGNITPEQVERLEQIGMCWLGSNDRIWEEKFEEARSHFLTTGRLLPPFKTTSLRNWIINQRRKFNNKTLEKEKISRLESIGMIWDLDENWERMFSLASKYYRENGDLDIPSTYITASGEKLGRWYRLCLTDSRKGKMSEERRSRLAEIGFNDEPIKSRAWQKYYLEAEKYKQKNGDLKIPAAYVTEDGLKLGTWLAAQRYNRSIGRLSADRIALLDELQIDWQSFDAKWASAFEELEKYKEAHGDVNVSADFVTEDGFKLGVWVTTQRSRRQAGKLSREKIDSLDGIGFVWNPRDEAWERTFAALKRFKETRGTLDIPDGILTEDGIALRSWLANQRTKFRTGKLSADKAQRLLSLGADLTAPKQPQSRASDALPSRSSLT